MTGSPSGPMAGASGSCSTFDVDVVLLLPAVGVQALVEVALVVEQPDADQRHAQVRGALEVVAGQDAQAARVDGHATRQAELGRKKVRHGSGTQDAGHGGVATSSCRRGARAGWR